MSLQTARLQLLFTPRLCARDPWWTLEEALLGGVDVVQWRVAEPDPADLARCIHVCRPHEVPVIVNDHVQLAAWLDAAGAHVGQQDMELGEARRILGPRWLGVSTHDLDQLRAAQDAGADYVGFGPCFPTSTKGYEEGLPRELIAAAAAEARVPLFAIGGVHRRNLSLLLDLGIRRIALCSALLAAEQPREEARRIRALLEVTG